MRIRLLPHAPMGRKQEYADSRALSMSSATKAGKKLTDHYGKIDYCYMSDMRRIENADMARFHESDISDLHIIELVFNDLNYNGWENEESKIKK